jgi:hydroxyacylglutathione hydrolase
MCRSTAAILAVTLAIAATLAVLLAGALFGPSEQPSPLQLARERAGTARYALEYLKAGVGEYAVETRVTADRVVFESRLTTRLPGQAPVTVDERLEFATRRPHRLIAAVREERIGDRSQRLELTLVNGALVAARSRSNGSGSGSGNEPVERRTVDWRYDLATHLGLELALASGQTEAGRRIDVGHLDLQALQPVARHWYIGARMPDGGFLLRDGATPLGVFTGGTLIVGGVARPDLLGPEHTEPLARAAWRSIRERLLVLPDELAVYPTHGTGSFCSAGPGTERTSTIGAERRANPLLQASHEEAFVERLLVRLGSYPPYFRELRPVNRAGPRLYGVDPPPLAALTPAHVEDLGEAGAEVVDVRGIEAFAAGHVPGSLSNAQRAQFATWLGWLVDRQRALVFVTDAHTDRRALVRACLGIGYEQFAGELAGGVEAWRASGRPLAQIQLRTPGEVEQPATVLDVRQRAEWAAGHVPGAVHVELGDLGVRAGELDGGPVVAHCGHGERAMTAASILARAGHRNVAALAGGPDEIAAARGATLEREA